MKKGRKHMHYKSCFVAGLNYFEGVSAFKKTNDRDSLQNG